MKPFLLDPTNPETRQSAIGSVVTQVVKLDGKRVLKTSETVRVGNIIAFPLREQVRVLRVVALPLRRGTPTEARTCYEELDPQPAGTGVDGETSRT